MTDERPYPNIIRGVVLWVMIVAAGVMLHSLMIEQALQRIEALEEESTQHLYDIRLLELYAEQQFESRESLDEEITELNREIIRLQIADHAMRIYCAEGFGEEPWHPPTSDDE